MHVLILALIGLAIAIVFAALLVISRQRPGTDLSTRQRRHRDSDAHASRAEAEAAMEEHDVDDMFDAILERRRARGRRELGDAMAEELLREDGQQ
jgi:hypothetical protein